MAQDSSQGRLIIVSNRLPMILTKSRGAPWSAVPASGGLISALAPILRNRGGVWIGWPGVVAEEADAHIAAALQHAVDEAGYDLVPVILSKHEHDAFYLGFSNEIIWPLFHDLQSRCNFDPEYWAVYEQVNRMFAERVAEHARQTDYIWVHDYHLMHVAHNLRALGIASSIGFFCHIPFPPLDIFLKLPWRAKILRALLEYDLVGFQTLRDRQNFVHCVRTLLKDVSIRGKGQVIAATVGDREMRLGNFPIGIDFREMAQRAATSEVTARIAEVRSAMPDPRIILGVDRLDYTKGIPQRLNAFRLALEQFPELHRQVTLTQVVVPSRTDIPEYADLKAEIERLVGEINGQYTQYGWVPIQYIFRPLDPVELLAYYRMSEIALVTPLKDGMNLVAKEYCACSIEDGILILSEFAGAAPQLQKGALLINPYDVVGTAEAIYQAWTMPRAERRARMQSLRRSVREQDIFWWVDSFIRAGSARDLGSFPVLDDYVPVD